MKIVTTPHPSLHLKAQPIITWDKKLDTQIKQMIALLENSHHPKGMGLAATQVERQNRAFLLAIDNKIHTFLNPKITHRSKKTLIDVYKNEKKRWLEGCLSIPTIWGFVNRPSTIEIQYQLPETLKKIETKFDDFHAAAFQHELDHLNGILFTDRLLKQQGTIYQQTEKGLKPIELIKWILSSTSALPLFPPPS